MINEGKLLNKIQLALDVAGLEPTIGTFADGSNSLISLLRAAASKEKDSRKQHLINAGISAISLIPFADVIKLLKLRRLSKPATKAAIKGIRGVKTASKGYKNYSDGDDVNQLPDNEFKKYSENTKFGKLYEELCDQIFEGESPCWDGYERVPNTKEGEKGSCRKKRKKRKPIKEKIDKDKMKCNKPRYLRKDERGSSNKKSVVKACKDGKEKIIRFGDANMEIKKDNPKNRKNFRSRHNCKNKKDKFTAGYWSCKAW